MDIEKLTIHDSVDLLNNGKCTSEELVASLLKTIEKRDPDIDGYLSVDTEKALDDARKCDQARLAGESGKLLGVPIAVKDVLNVKDQSCTCASRILEGYKSPYDATAIAKLRHEGAIFLGRTNMDEFAMGSSTENSAFKVTKNRNSLGDSR